jgi:16S rRNA (cytidine1402-2'-O)-methyltransferase
MPIHPESIAPDSTSQRVGVLYVVATPIGHLSDISARALEVLRQSDEILCEDTRTSGVLLRHYGVNVKLSALHNFNEAQKTQSTLAKLCAGQHIALISDAGTPLISDPGFLIVAAARSAGYAVRAVPGACALIAALSICGLPCERFCFEGFLPAASKGRRDRLSALVDEPRTLVFYESTHRISQMIDDIVQLFGADRRISVVKEITKHFEQCFTDSAANVAAILAHDSTLERGEFVVIVQGAPEISGAQIEAKRIFAVLSEAMAKSQAAKLAAKLTGVNRRTIYAETGEE